MKRDERDRQRRWGDVGFVTALFVASKTLVLGIAVLGPLLLKTDARFRGSIAEVGWRAYVNVWDVGWYGNVALDGYRYVPGGDSNVAFFPLFPLLLRGFTAVGVDFIVAGLLISNVCFALSLWLLLRLTERETGRRESAEWAVVLLAFSPAAAWFSLGLTESLFLFLTLALATAARAQKWGWMAVAGLLAGLTRPNGFLLALPAVVLVWRMATAARDEHRWRSLLAIWTAAVAPIVGHLCFLAYLQVAFGDWRAAQLAAAVRWQNRLSFTWDALSQRLPGLGLRLFDQPSIYQEHVAWSWVFVLAAGAVAAIALWERRGAGWHGALLLGFFAFHAFMFTGSMPAGPIARYAAAVPAFYVGLALFGEHRRWAGPVVLAFSVAALTIQTAMIFAGYHIN